MSKFLAASFASLMGYGSKAKGSRAEEDEEKKEKDAKGVRSEDDDEKKGGDAKGRADDGDDGETDAEGDDDKKDAKGRAKGKADDDAGADDEEDDDAAESDDDGDEKKDAKSKEAAKAERQRCARIISHGIKCGRVEQAGVFAFDTGMSSASAIAALNAAGAAAPAASKSGGLRERMSAVAPVQTVEAAAAPTGNSLAEQIVQAGKIRRGEQ